MSSGRRPKVPISDTHRALGAELRRIRQAAGKSTREIGGYTSGHISQVERGLVTPSAEIIEEYVLLGGDRGGLVMALADLRQQSDERRRQTRLSQRGQVVSIAELTAESNPVELRAGYRLDLMDDSYKIGPNRVPERIMHRVRVHTLSAHTRYFVLAYGYEVDPRPGVIAVESVAGCRLARLREMPTGSVDFVLEFDRGAASADATDFEFSYEIHINSKVPTKPMLRSGTRSGVSQCTRRVQFNSSDAPSKAWWFREPEVLATESAPVRDRLLSPDAEGSYEQTFIDVRREFYGIAWEW